MGSKLGEWSFIIGIVIAVLVGFVQDPNLGEYSL